MSVSSPTTCLPALKTLVEDCTTLQVKESLENLRRIYFPRVLVSSPPSTSYTTPPPITTPATRSGTFITPISKKNKKSPFSQRGYDTPIIVDSGYASAEEEGDDNDNERALGDALSIGVVDLESRCKTLNVLRADPFERAFAVRWLTGFISRAEEWAELEDLDEEDGDVVLIANPVVEVSRAELLEEALDLLSAFSNGEINEQEDEDPEMEEAYTRIFTFQTGSQDSAEKSPPITVEINDQLNFEDHTSVGLQSWGSSIIFGESFCASPSSYFGGPPGRPSPRRILELGAGTGITSIAAAKLLANQRPEIVATDFHPDVLENLKLNIKLNFPPSPSISPSTPIAVLPLDWANPDYCAPYLDKRFEVILGTDVVYEPEHATWIKGCVRNLLCLPTQEHRGGTFWLFIAVRNSGRHEGLHKTVDELFGYRGAESDCDGDGVGPWKLAILTTEEINKRGGVGRADENAYMMFEIGWVRA
ncbi:hypothetical protein FA15DRAFT_672480 [Coprinopsis marcescibilis]|uniref:S-adenosyl-L-methionine-dependent methyltransferase n=1 Tax=Coprinopsis marcescibilis TaxID=230819 RepID=A0A5C3KNA0_COPMA|nr:hypothetical protein FA15DRAFT_672480 [Coprinopsis marcescibilis]